MIKKYIAVIISLSFLVTLFGCADDVATPKKKTDSKGTSIESSANEALNTEPSDSATEPSEDVTNPEDMEDSASDAPQFEPDENGIVATGIVAALHGEGSDVRWTVYPGLHLVVESVDGQKYEFDYSIWSTDLGQYRDWIVSVTFKEGLNGVAGLEGMPMMESVSIPEGAYFIAHGAFSGSEKLESVTLPASVNDLRYSAFSYCTGLKEVTILGNIPLVEDGTFRGCSSLKSVTLPDSVRRIEEEAFKGCTSLESLTIPARLNLIEEDALADCSALKDIYYGGSEYTWPTVWYHTYYGNNEKAIENATIHFGATGFTVDIDKYDYESQNPLTTGSFGGTDRVKWLRMNDDVMVISGKGRVRESTADSFKSCFETTRWLIVEDGVTELGAECFSGSNRIIDARIADTVMIIGDMAFARCAYLSSIRLPANLESIGNSAFSLCTRLTDVYYPGTEEEWNQIEIGEYNEALTGATIHFNCER